VAEDDDKDQRTEQASGKRLAKAREEGDVAIGRDVSMFASLAVGSVMLMWSGTALRDRLVRLVQGCVLVISTGQTRDILPLVISPAGLGLGVCAAAGAAAVVAMIAQTGGGFWLDRVMPDPSKMFGGGKLTRLFKLDTATDLGISLVKMLTLGWVLWSSVRDDFMTLPNLLRADTATQLAGIFRPLVAGLAKILTGLGLIAGVDFALTKYRYAERMKMTKEEAKREYKEDEGDPMIRSRRKQKHRAMIKGLINVEVPKADALIVNPTHIAIAIRYRAGEDAAPRVTAKGKGALAETMRDLARQNGVPIVQDIPLARLLYKRVKVGRAVPTETFKAVAAVLAYVYRILGKTPNTEHLRQGGNR
jgi:flagellar biosynthesis protein FlhB